MAAPKPQVNINDDYEQLYGFHVPEHSVFKAEPGLDEGKVKQISGMKGEPKWMTDIRLRAYRHFMAKPMPVWANTELLNGIPFDSIYYYLKSTEKKSDNWEDVPEDIKKTFERLGIPEAERKFLAGVSAQYECLTGDTRVLANPIVKPIKDIEPGAYVYSLNETTKRLEKQRVKRLMPKGERQVYEVVVAGRTLKATANHPLLALTYAKPPGRQRGRFGTRWAYLSDLNVGDYVAVAKELPDEGKPHLLPEISFESTYQGRNQLGVFPVSTGRLLRRQQPTLTVPRETSEAFMWFLGLYLGDGYVTRDRQGALKRIVNVAIPASDTPLRNRLRQVLKDIFGYSVKSDRERYRVRIHALPLVKLLERLGLDEGAHTKRVPVWVFGVPKSQKLAFLAGFIDADGYVRNTATHNDVSITSCNRALLGDLHLLAITCGFRVSQIHRFQSSHTYKGQKKFHDGYRIYLYGDLSSLKSYSVRCDKDVIARKWYQGYCGAMGSPITAHTSDHLGFAKIQSIRPLGVEPVYDIEVEGSHNFVAEGLIVHNSESVYHSMREDLQKQGVIFLDMDTALKEQPEIVKRYFGTVIPPADNKFAALNTSVWSGGSFIYVPKGVSVAMPLQAYFRINAKNMGQFERTLIIADEGAQVTYFEGCTAPVYSSDSLHSAVVELIAMPHARIRYVTIQNWSKNVYNLVTKRAVAHEGATVEWLDGNLGCVGEGELVHTEHGPAPIETVQPGTRVWSFDESARQWRLRPVVARKDSGEQQVYDVVCSNGRTVRLTASHPLLKIHHDPSRPKKLGRYSMRWTPLEELSVGEWIVYPTALPMEGASHRFAQPALNGHFTGRNQYGASYRVASHARLPITLPPQADEDVCWMLGLWLADGDSTMTNGVNGGPRFGRVGWSVPRQDRARKRLVRLLRRYMGKVRLEERKDGHYFRTNSLELALWLKANGLCSGARRKRVPAWVFALPLRMRLAFLAGYLDGDGCAHDSGLVVKSASRELLLDAQALATQCGVHAGAVHTDQSFQDINKTGTFKSYVTHRLALSRVEALRPFLSPRLRSRVKPSRNPHHYQQLAGLRTTRLLPETVGATRITAIRRSRIARTYDLQIDGTCSFIVNGILVHNSRLTMKYPGVYLMGRGARGEVLSVAFASDGQHQDAGAKMIHAAPDTSSVITSKSISKGTGRTSYRGLVKVYPGAVNAKSTVRCDALLLNPASRSDTYPTMEIDEKRVQIGHEATVSKIGDEQLFYAMSRGLTEPEAMQMIVNGFIEPFVKELPLEYAVELNRLVQLEMEGAVG